jgi:hypothetical protein
MLRSGDPVRFIPRGSMPPWQSAHVDLRRYARRTMGLRFSLPPRLLKWILRVLQSPTDLESRRRRAAEAAEAHSRSRPALDTCRRRPGNARRFELANGVLPEEGETNRTVALFFCFALMRDLTAWQCPLESAQAVFSYVRTM